MRLVALVSIASLSVSTGLHGVALALGVGPRRVDPPEVALADDRPPARRGGPTENASSWLYLREPLAQDLARFLRIHVAEVKVRSIRDPGTMFDPEPFDRLVFAGDPRAVKAVDDFAHLFLGPPVMAAMANSMMEEALRAQGRGDEVAEGRARLEAERRPVEMTYRLTPSRARAVASMIQRRAMVPIKAKARDGELRVACSPEDHRRLAPMLLLLKAERAEGVPTTRPSGG